ncbi:hypothetical protein EDB81DRAFT_849452 [Dactylonectria macrodidyma]|uniref:Uncharacterized protein n=1 Tax=Dactylonectria macrodidyma TaxID=307937 RepID=A0A9P9I736_9HYPO|nr:hypothetical protein EDB81DRAFT_849452 [Dactylonectria macrodidyma]
MNNEHADTKLFVLPICWTGLHARILGTRWRELPPCDSPKSTVKRGDPPTQGHLQPSRTISALSESLTEILQPDAKDNSLCSAITTVLKILWPKPFSELSQRSKLHLYFRDRVYRDAVRVQIMWNFLTDKSRSKSFRPVSTCSADCFNTLAVDSSIYSQAPANLPMLCYIGGSQIANRRRNLLRVLRGLENNTGNEPGDRLRKLKAKLLVPSNSSHDAYLVGVFLAMAQKHFYPPPSVSSRRSSLLTKERTIPSGPNFQNIKLRILTHGTDTSDFIVYTGYVTKEFLEKFRNPSKRPRDSGEVELSGIRIEFTRVPIWPILGLRERLGQALGHDVVGHFSCNEIETWEKDPEKQERGKRKRGDPWKAKKRYFNGGALDQGAGM